jgi:putative FmdB family regulatory protein
VSLSGWPGAAQRRWSVQAIPRAAEEASQFIGRLGKRRTAGTPMARLARSREIRSLFPLTDVGSPGAIQDWTAQARYGFRDSLARCASGCSASRVPPSRSRPRSPAICAPRGVRAFRRAISPDRAHSIDRDGDAGVSYRCEDCGATFDRIERISKHETAKPSCPECGSDQVARVGVRGDDRRADLIPRLPCGSEFVFAIGAAREPVKPRYRCRRRWPRSRAARAGRPARSSRC